MNTIDTLLAYSEWLDGEGLVASDQGEIADKRPHDQLVRDFIESRVNRGEVYYDRAGALHDARTHEAVA